MDISALPLGTGFLLLVAWGYSRHLKNEEKNGKPEDRDGPDPR